MGDTRHETHSTTREPMRWKVGALGIAVGAALWGGAALVVAGQSDTAIPSDWTHGPPSGTDMVSESLGGLVEVGALAVLVWVITRRRTDVRPLASFAASRTRAARDLRRLAAYSVAALALAWALPQAVGWEPFSWHLVGTLHGTHAPPGIAETLSWAVFNLVVFAVVPWVWFGGRGQLPLRSTSLRGDALLVVAVLVCETVVQVVVLRPDTFELDTGALLMGGSFTFVLYLAGAVLPTVILIQAVLLPRVHRLTGSTMWTVLAGGAAYALFHLWDGGFDHSRPLVWAAMLILVYLGPGLIKSWITVRSGNAWTHAWAYHAFAPHVLLDTPLIVMVFQL